MQRKIINKNITKINAQYPKLSIKVNTDFHDRFLIIDKTEAYPIGVLINHAGRKLWHCKDIR